MSQNESDSHEQGNSILWEITRDDLTFKSYIFGTHHLFNSSFIDSSKVINELLNSVKAVTLETEYSELDTAAMLEKIKLKDDESYNFPTVEDEEYLKNYLSKNAKLKVFSYSYFIMKPMAIWAALIYLDYSNVTKTDISSYIAIDAFFEKESKRLNKELNGLETMEEQFSLLMDSIPLNVQLDILMETIKQKDYVKELSYQLMDSCYKNQRIDCIGEMGIFGNKYPQENEMFLERRNKRWMKSIPMLINYNSNFIAVGARHLPGEYGLLNLLRKEGYTLKPIRF